MTSLYSKTSVFVRPHLNQRRGNRRFRQESPLWGPYFEDLRFFYSKTPFMHQQNAKMENTRISVFKNILDCEQSVIFLCKVTACETQERERGG